MRLIFDAGYGVKTTGKHESFHIVFKNYLKPKVKQRLLESAKTLSNEEGSNYTTDKELEEWMARDFAKGERISNQNKPTIVTGKQVVLS